MQLSETEWKVMRVVWEQHPVSARDVLEAVGDETGWAYTTTKTILSRLADKGAVDVKKRANTSLYSPAVTRAEARGVALRGLLERAFDGTFGALMHHLIDADQLSQREVDELRALLERERKPTSERESE